MRKDLIRKITYIPTLPEVLAQILSLLNDPTSSAGDLEKIITHDQALSAKVLAVANTAYYGFRHEIITVRRAVVAMGYEEIRNVCLGASLMGYLHPSTFQDKQAAELLWLHSLCVAEAARLLAHDAKTCRPDAAFTAGLLHDLGKVVLSAFFPKEQDAVYELMEKEGLSYRAAEKAQEVDHCMVGRVLAKIWDLPSQLEEALGFHHEPQADKPHFAITASVHLADCMARQIGLGHSGNPDKPEIDPDVLDALGISDGQYLRTREQLDSRRRAVIDLWKMILGSLEE